MQEVFDTILLTLGSIDLSENLIKAAKIFAKELYGKMAEDVFAFWKLKTKKDLYEVVDLLLQYNNLTVEGNLDTINVWKDSQELIWS